MRQRIKNALQRIASRRARRAEACRQFHDYLLARLRPEEDEFIGRLLDFVETELAQLPRGPNALKLVLALLNKAGDERLLSEALRAAQERDEAEHEEQKRLAHQGRLRQKMARHLESVVWPSTKRLMVRGTPLTQARKVNPDSDGKPGSFYSAKLGRNVEYESQLERRFFMLLECLDEVVTYQEQPYAVPYMLDGKPLTYYPDVVFILESGEAIVAELKPCLHMALHVTRCKWKSLQAFCEERGLGMLMTDDRGRTLETLKQTRVPATFETALLKKLERGPLRWRDIADLRMEDVPCHAPQAVVLRHDLVMRLEPFSIERKKQR
ncbi:hypothetical protein BO221_40715 [Archangium sp. Cb G35]|nr:hypothetical protein BO221_40715 [Archangium sp. Cb G35]